MYSLKSSYREDLRQPTGDTSTLMWIKEQYYQNISTVLILQYLIIFGKVKIVNVGIWTHYFEIHSEYVLTPWERKFLLIYDWFYCLFWSSE